MTKTKELQLLRQYFRASEIRRKIGNGDYKPYDCYGYNVAESNIQLQNLTRFSEELLPLGLLDFIK
jgi:hypothetical protein